MDDLIIEKTDQGVEIYRKNGLALTSASDFQLEKEAKAKAKEGTETIKLSRDDYIYDFQNWQLGGLKALADNESLILSSAPGLIKSEQAESFLTLAKMYLANGMGAEAVGFLDMATELLPELARNPDYKAILGASHALNGHYEQAFKILGDPKISDKQDVRFWRTFALAKLQDWQQAETLLPATFAAMRTYPTEVTAPLALMLGESALRAGDLKRWSELSSILRDNKADLRPHYLAAYQYLEGESLRQNNKLDETIKIWSDLAEGKDDLYKVKAGLALTRLEREERDLPVSEAVDRLEKIRFSWRGDDLEAQVNYWLGRIYFEYKDYVKGLNIMRDAASFATGPHLGQKVTAEMTQEFSNLFLGEDLKTIAAPEAAALYDRYSELIPGGEKGDTIARNLAERLLKANLYQKSAELLSYQLNNRLKGADAYNVAVRLSGIYLLDNKPDEAMDALSKAKDISANDPSLATKENIERLTLIEAQIMAQNNQPAQALAMLEEKISTPQINKLRADIAWKSGFWEDAAVALSDIIEDEIGVIVDTVNAEQADLIMRRAVALSLAGDRIRLGAMRKKYTPAINKTDKAKVFEVITRPRRGGELADRDTLMSIVSEVDLYEGFLAE